MAQYWTAVLTEASIFAVLALGIDMIWGWAGDFDLSAYAYFALGVYMTMVLTIGKPKSPVEYILGRHLPYLLAVAIAVVVVVAFASIIGAIALRNLREIYFSITTFGAVWAIYYFVENYTPLFNGYNGVYGLFDPMGGGLSYAAYHYFFLGFCAVVLVLVYLLVQRLSKSPFGRVGLRAKRLLDEVPDLPVWRGARGTRRRSVRCLYWRLQSTRLEANRDIRSLRGHPRRWAW
jgi:branched-chain amino acid transport system permease protein